jgi:hypothetical protein
MSTNPPSNTAQSDARGNNMAQSFILSHIRAKICISTRDNLDLDSNLTEVSDIHPRNQHSPKISIDTGMAISINPFSCHAQYFSDENLDPDSNLISKSELHFEKYSSLKIQLIQES